MIDPTDVDEGPGIVDQEGGPPTVALEPGDASPPASASGDSPATRRATMPRLTLEDIVAAQDLAEDTIDVPEWGGSLLVRAMTKQRQIEIRDEGVGEKGLTELLMFAACVIEPPFTAADVTILRGKAAAVFDRVMRRILELNGANAGAVEQAKARFPTGS